MSITLYLYFVLDDLFSSFVHVVHLVSLLSYNAFVAIITALCLHTKGELIVQYHSLYTSFVAHFLSFGVRQVDVIFLKGIT